MKLVAVVLNWNGGEDTPRALASLDGIETICVDNGSTDGSDAVVERDFPAVELIRTGANLGFAGGNNVGIRRALERGADWVLLVNNDAVVEPGIAEALERAAAARPDAGLLACKVLFEDGATVMYAGASFRAWLGYSGRVTGYGGPDRFHELRDVGRADGAAMAVSRAAAERAGLLDERLFAYVEDVDWSLRIRAAGFAVVFVPDAVVLPQGLGLDRRRRLDGEPLLLDAEHDLRRRAGAPAAARAARPAPRRRRRDAPRAGVVASAPARGDAGGARGWRDARAGRTAVRAARGRRPRGRGPSPPTRRASRARGRAPTTRSGAASTSSTRGRDRLGVVRVEEPRRVADDLRQRRDVRARDRAAARHRLERRLAEALVQRREDERRRAAVEADELVHRDGAAHLDAVRHRARVAAAREHEPQLRPLAAHERERLEQPLVVLVRPAPRRVEQERLALDRRVRPEQLVVDPEVDRPHAAPGRARAARRRGRARTS